MKLKLLGLAFAFITAVQGVSAVVNQTTPVALAPQAQEARAAHVAAALLSRYHYKAMPLDEALSGRIFDQYLKTLDPEKTFLSSLISINSPSGEPSWARTWSKTT